MKNSIFSNFNYDIGGILTIEKNSKIFIYNVTLNKTFTTKEGGSIYINENNKIIIRNA